MSDWTEIVTRLRREKTPAILVSVDSTVGSTPREPGARMIVTTEKLYGTIGGGNLEFQACRIARDQLVNGSENELRKFPLGAGLGQCCGGLVNLMFERLHANSDWASIAREEAKIDLYLFGAGHVGQAVVRALRGLARITWIDTRDDMLPARATDGMVPVCTDTPEVEIDAAPGGSFFLVMTHDHALDQRLSEQILARNDFHYFGLIGSKAKRRNFETRLRRRGVDPACLARMTCPIGIDGINGKQPERIAISVAAEILQVYDRLQNNKQDINTKATQYKPVQLRGSA